MKTTLKISMFACMIALTSSCSSRSESATDNSTEFKADSVQRVAPESDGMPSAGGVPSNAGSPPDSAALSTDSTSNQ